jgi:polysaccharide export outer membrane protein
MRQVFLIVAGIFLATAAWAQAEYRVGAGDVLGIEVLDDPSLNRDVLVLPGGTFTFPFAGTLNALGLTIPQVEATISQAIAPNFAAEPSVFVTVRRVATEPPMIPGAADAEDLIDIFFLGEVNSPGPVQVPEGTTFLQALSFSGGLTPFAADRRVQLRRTDPHTRRQHVTEIDYRAISRGAKLSQNVPLVEGDVILVPERRLFE